MYEVDLFIESVISALLVAGDLSLAFLASLPLAAIAWAYVPMASNKAIRVPSAPLPVVEGDSHRNACLAYMAEQRAETELEARIEATIQRLSSPRVAGVGEWIEATDEESWNGITIITEECVLLVWSDLIEHQRWVQALWDWPCGSPSPAAFIPMSPELFGPTYWWDHQDRYDCDEEGTIYYIE